MTPIPGEPPQRGMRRHTRLVRATSLAAAMLIIGVLIVVSVLHFNRQGTGNTAPSGTPPISITLSRCASLPRAGLVDLCAHQQFTDLLQWRKMGEYVLVLERAYVDMNQLVITYRVFSQSSGQETFAPLYAVITTSHGQSFLPSAGAWASGGPQVAQFSTPPLPAQTRMLQLHIEVKDLYIEGLPPAPQRTAVPGPVTFDLMLEYHGGLTVTPHQTVTVKGISVTLERVRISPSETIIDATTQGAFPNTLSDTYTFSLDAAGRSSGLTPEGWGGFGADRRPFTAVTYDGLFEQQGTWTFELRPEAGTQGPWVVHFTVP